MSDALEGGVSARSRAGHEDDGVEKWGGDKMRRPPTVGGAPRSSSVSAWCVMWVYKIYTRTT